MKIYIRAPFVCRFNSPSRCFLARISWEVEFALFALFVLFVPNIFLSPNFSKQKKKKSAFKSLAVDATHFLRFAFFSRSYNRSQCVDDVYCYLWSSRRFPPPVNNLNLIRSIEAAPNTEPWHPHLLPILLNSEKIVYTIETCPGPITPSLSLRPPLLFLLRLCSRNLRKYKPTPKHAPSNYRIPTRARNTGPHQ